jgi:5'(3')-deoxyribonucleotidase
MVVKIDVDGVIRDIITAMCQIYNKKFGGNLCSDDIVDYDINTNFHAIAEKTGMKPTDYFFREHADDIFLYVSQPFEGIKEAIDTLRSNGHKVVIVTWQFNLENIMHTLRFLDVHGIRYDDICFTKDKWMIKGDYLIDDNPEFIMDKRDKSKKIVVDTPYNRNVSKKYKRVNSLKDAIAYIINNNREENKEAA